MHDGDDHEWRDGSELRHDHRARSPRGRTWLNASSTTKETPTSTDCFRVTDTAFFALALSTFPAPTSFHTRLLRAMGHIDTAGHHSPYISPRQHDLMKLTSDKQAHETYVIMKPRWPPCNCCTQLSADQFVTWRDSPVRLIVSIADDTVNLF